MQINELLLKNFGKFHDRQIDLDEGINLIHGENESGKSTIHTFIRGMLFGIERGRGRAAQNDTFSIYEPWENPNYYSGILKFKSGEKHFRIERNFDKYSKKAELICEEDGEVLSVEDGDLQMLLGEMDAERYDNTVSMSQRNAQMGESIVAELKNYATNYYTSGNGEIDLAGALEQLRGRKKILENEIRMEMAQKQQKREKLEQEVSFVWRDVHHLEEELERVEEELAYRLEKEEEKKTPACACSCGCAASEAESITNDCCPDLKEGEICCIKVLGAGCKSCHEQFEYTKQAVKDMGLSVEVEYITDMQKVMEYGVMSMPALVVNEKVVAMGKVLKAADVVALLHKLGF